MSVCLASEGDGSKKKNDRRGREGGLLHGRGPRASGLPPRPCRGRRRPSEADSYLIIVLRPRLFIAAATPIGGGGGGPLSFLCWLSPHR